MKYIIEIPDWIEWGVVTCRTEDGFYTRDFDFLEELNSDYINDHYGDLQDTAYQRGLEEGKHIAVGAAELREKLEYQKGFEDGKAVYDKGCEGCKYAGKVVTGPPCISCCNSYKNQWTAKQTDNEINVWDVVKHDGGHIFIVTAVGDIGVCGIDGDGDFKHSLKWNVHRTGRRFDISSILEAMKK